MTDPVPIPDEELDEIEQRAHAASPAPWEGFIEARDQTAGDDFIRIGGFDDAQPAMYIQHYLGASSVRVSPPTSTSSPMPARTSPTLWPR